MASRKWFRKTTAAAAVGFLALGGLAVFYASYSNAALDDYSIAQKPLYMGQSQPPLMMMVMSRDERLFTKAYSDYTDLDGDGLIDTTYNDSFSYAGYFDSKLCYGYGNGRFEAERNTVGSGHRCEQENVWSGNFLNWVTMSRLDVLRHVLYGGLRSTDTKDETVLERAHIPNDLHAWVKVYSGDDVKDFVPANMVKGNTNTISICNASFGVDGAPLMRVADGNWSEWAATAIYQCGINRNDYSGENPRNAEDLTVRVKVCSKPDMRENFCQPYSDGVYKPTGLLQTYGESGRLRFGLISGSYGKPRSGGVLRRNIGKLAGNGTASGCAAGDEINLITGQFCNQAAGDEGIINTLNRFKLTQWGGTVWNDCNTWGINNRVDGSGQLNNPGGGSQNCSAWGNPIAEMYAEALRYIAGETGPTSGFTGGSDLAGLPTSVVWKDPYRDPNDGGNSYCADCSILVLSSGLSSFDSDELPAVPRIGTAEAATDAVGSHEGISGSYLVGRVGATPLGAALNTHEDVCSAENVTSLSLVRGICPDIPSLEGSYMLAGLAHKAKVTDLRPGLQGKPAGHKNNVTTYSVALADNLPKFDIPVGGGKITLSPLCQANGDGSAGINSNGWRTCHLGSVGIGTKTASVSPNHVYGRPLKLDAAGNAVAGSFSLVWEDSLWGNDHDNDVVAMMTYCVGATCNDDTNPKNTGYTGKDICWRSDSPVCGTNGNPSVGANEVLVRIENLSAYAGNAMLSGFAVTGSNNDGVHRLALRPGSKDGSLLTRVGNPGAGDNEWTWDKPKVMKFTVGSSGAGLLETPLWYAAKYGGFEDRNGNGVPDAGEWDSRMTGTPDNYFFARDPSKLKEALDRIFSHAEGSNESTGGGGTGARIGSGSFTIESGFNVPAESNDWTGFLRGVEVKADGSAGITLWDAAGKIPSAADRKIFMVTHPTQPSVDGGADSPVVAAMFTASNLVGIDDQTKLASLGYPAYGPLPGVTPDRMVDYLRGTAVTGWRHRTSMLGDIVNSVPKIASPRDDLGYGVWASTAGDVAWKASLGTSYLDYLDAKKARDPVVYVGANDGMLHAFDATPSSAGGRELFAFIPDGSRRHIAALAHPDYDHEYFVDGAIAVSDVPFSASGSWRTLLVGSTGGGGAKRTGGGDRKTVGYGSVFGLDVSNPKSFDTNDVLWELSGEHDSKLGFVLGEPVIVPVAGSAGPRWVAIFGNGVNSADSSPTLFIVDVRTGALVRRLTPAGSGYASRNGLINVAPVALGNDDGLVDTVYGGDLQGNIWKFDLSDDSEHSWNVAFGDKPLFTAIREGVPQPVTGSIEISRGPFGGVNLYFGTGRYFAEGDNETSEVQSFYGIWDSPGQGPVAGRGALIQQLISAGTMSNGYTTRNISRNPVSYATSRGWYVDLVVGTEAAGERFIGAPRLQSGKVIFATYQPGAAICSAGGGQNWEYALDMLTGSGAMSGVTVTPDGASVCVGDCGAITLNPDGTGAPVRSIDIFVPQPFRPGTGATPPGACDPADPACVDDMINASKCTFVLRAAGAGPQHLPRPCGRQSWRQVR